VAVLAKNCHRYQEAYVAVARLGAVLVPLNHRLSARELEDILADCGADVMLIGPTFVPMWRTIRRNIPALRHGIVLAEHADADIISYEQLLQTTAPSVPDVERTPDDLLYLYYTSGTTGRAKGVMLSERNALVAVDAATGIMRLTSHERVLRVPNPFHVGGITVWSMLLTGACQLIVPDFDPAHYLQLMQDEHITIVQLVPTMINAMLNVPNVLSYDLSALRLLTYAASPMPDPLLRKTAETFRADLLQIYGMTELGYVTALLPEDHLLTGPEPLTRRVRSVGRALPGVEIRIVDDQDCDLTCDDIGEVLVRGPNVMLGYWNQLSTTDEALRNGWMHTGDVGTLDAAGYLYLVDRKKDMIITGGENVYSTEVESILYQHPAVLEAAVIGVADPAWGERVMALVVLKPGRTVTVKALQAFCRERMAGYKLPRLVEFLAALPKTTTGKISKTELRERYRDRVTRGAT
jgi:acyl-CoA synthetase (AMP-forming)/AMP-acid ligase II